MPGDPLAFIWQPIFPATFREADTYPHDAQPDYFRIADQPEILSSVLHKPRKYRIEPNPIPSRISGMIFSLNLSIRRSDSITQPRESGLICLRPTTSADKITAFPRKSVRSRIAPTTTAVISVRTPSIVRLP